MPRLRVFVSSTCYDLAVLRSELRPFLLSLGHEPVMSDHSDVLYDHRVHTHESCVQDIKNADVVLVIIGSRFGGVGIPKLQDTVDLEALRKESTKPEVLSESGKLSITQLEVLKAVDLGIPIYAFVDGAVMHDHLIFEKNRNNPDVARSIKYGSIEKTETAEYIFKFINYIRGRQNNNSIQSFSNLDTIKSHLISQWSQLFQRLLYENREAEQEAKRLNDFAQQIDDLKAVILASIATPDLRETARNAIKFRNLIAFVSALFRGKNIAQIYSDIDFSTLLSHAGISSVATIGNSNKSRGVWSKDLFLISDEGVFHLRPGGRYLLNMLLLWEELRSLDQAKKQAVVAGLLEDQDLRSLHIVHFKAVTADEDVMIHIASRDRSPVEQDSVGMVDVRREPLGSYLEYIRSGEDRAFFVESIQNNPQGDE
ncbi:MAG: DUF4062 domain-containing protein [Pseudomonadota bacterium]